MRAGGPKENFSAFSAARLPEVVENISAFRVTVVRLGRSDSEKGLRDALDRIKPLFTDKTPFESPPPIPEKIQWVKPKLV